MDDYELMNNKLWQYSNFSCGIPIIKSDVSTLKIGVGEHKANGEIQCQRACLTSDQEVKQSCIMIV